MEKAAILNRYIEENGSRPRDLKAIQELDAEAAGQEDLRPYETFAWTEFFSKLIDEVTGQEVYLEYACRERFLAFCYSLEQALNENPHFGRSYLSDSLVPGVSPSRLNGAAEVFRNYATELLAQGVETGEVKERPFLMDHYPEAAWKACLLIMDFWRKDRSEESEQTDVMIEKSVNSFFDMVGHLPIDSIIDLGKFLWQSKS
jgi:hypothetical protein